MQFHFSSLCQVASGESLDVGRAMAALPADLISVDSCIKIARSIVPGGIRGTPGCGPRNGGAARGPEHI